MPVPWVSIIKRFGKEVFFMEERLAGIAEEMGFKGAQLASLDTASAAPEAGQIARMERDFKIFRTLQEIRNRSGTDKEKYIQGTAQEAYEAVLRNKDDLIKINELRAEGTPEALSKVQEMFKAKP